MTWTSTTTTMQTDLARRETLTSMLVTYRQAVRNIETAYGLLESAQKELQAAFLGKPGYSFKTDDRDMHDRVGKEASEQILKKIKRDAWNVVVERLELRRHLSIKRQDELDTQLRNGDGLPELTEENILAMFQSSAANVDMYLQEAV